MHVDTWLERLGGAGGEPRRRLVAALDDSGRTRGRCSRRSPARRPSSRHGILAEPMAAIESRWRAETEHDADRPRPRGAAADARSGRPPGRRHSDGASGLLHAEFTMVRRSEVGRDVVSGRHASASPSPPGSSRPSRAETAVRVEAALAAVHDPEIPTVSIVDLGLVHDVEATDGRHPGRAPADVRRLSGARGHPRRPSPTRSPASAARSRSSSRSPSRGRRIASRRRAATASARPGSPRRRTRRTSAARTAPPPGSRWTAPSARRSAGSLFYCRECRQPFEAFKPV